MNTYHAAFGPLLHATLTVTLSICGDCFKTARKSFLMKLVERMPRVCKVVKGGYFEESLLNIFGFVSHFFGYYMIPYVLFHSIDVFIAILHILIYFHRK